MALQKMQTVKEKYAKLLKLQQEIDAELGAIEKEVKKYRIIAQNSIDKNKIKQVLEFLVKSKDT